MHITKNDEGTEGMSGVSLMNELTTCEQPVGIRVAGGHRPTARHPRRMLRLGEAGLGVWAVFGRRSNKIMTSAAEGEPWIVSAKASAGCGKCCATAACEATVASLALH